MNLLESAGFSRSNPYYIVKQGKVRDECSAKPNLMHSSFWWCEMNFILQVVVIGWVVLVEQTVKQCCPHYLFTLVLVD